MQEYWGDAWEEVYDAYLLAGGDPEVVDGIQPEELRDWRDVEEDVIDSIMFTVASSDFPLAPRVQAWTDEGVSHPFKDGFTVDGWLVPSEMLPSLGSALAPFEDRLRDLAEELAYGMQAAVAREVRYGRGLARSPFIAGPRARPDGQPLLVSSMTVGGWSVAVSLAAADHPEIASIQSRIVEVRQARSAELRRVIAAHRDTRPSER